MGTLFAPGSAKDLRGGHSYWVDRERESVSIENYTISLRYKGREV